MSITVTNSGSTLKEGKLSVEVSDRNGNVMDKKTVDGLQIPAGLTYVMTYDLKQLPSNLYSAEYYLYDQKGTEVARSLDVFLVE